MINRELSSRLAAGHGRRVTQLAEAATRWGGHVLDDPGITELADFLETAAQRPRPPRQPRHTPRALLAGAVENLRAPPGSAAFSPRPPSGTCSAP